MPKKLDNIKKDDPRLVLGFFTPTEKELVMPPKSAREIEGILENIKTEFIEINTKSYMNEDEKKAIIESAIKSNKDQDIIR